MSSETSGLASEARAVGRSKVRTIIGWIAVASGVVGPCIVYRDYTHHMSMPPVLEQASWFVMGAAWAAIGLWLALRLRPWWLYVIIVAMLMAVYVGLVEQVEAQEHAELQQFLLRSMSR